MRIAALDIGGTAIKYGLWDGEQLTEQHETPSDIRSAKALVAQMESAVRSLGEVDAVGISTRGQVNGNGEILFDNGPIPDYTGTPVKKILQQALGIPVHVENDVNAAAWGEACKGAGKGHNDFLCLTFGTGIGGAIILNHQLYRGANWSAGEFGAMQLFSQKPAWNGEGGAYYESFASASALVERVRIAVPSVTNGRQVCSNLEHPVVAPIVAEWVQNVSFGLSSLAHIFNPSLIVLGGGILQNDDLFHRIESCTRSQLMGGFECLTLAKTKLGNQAGMIGAALLAQAAL